MKERGMIFNEYQVCALLDGSMTQTRRPLRWKRTRFTEIGERDDGSNWPWSEDCENCCDYWHPCPFGEIGDHLWVRESFGEDYDYHDHQEMPGCPSEHFHYDWLYRADGEINKKNLDGCFSGWKSPIHMPRKASRITLEITRIRVERLQNADEFSLLDELGAMLEYDDTPAGRAFSHAEHYAIAGVPVGMSPEMHGFKAWWDKVNGAGSFDTNPWCWVIEFRRLEA